MRSKIVASLVLIFVTCASTERANAQCAIPNVLTNGAYADATMVMANFYALANCANPGGSANALQYNGGAGAFGGVGPLNNGQFIIGSTGNPPQAATLTAGTGIGITNGPGSVTISATSPGAFPGGSTNDMQFNAGSGAFGGVTMGDAQLLIGEGAGGGAFSTSPVGGLTVPALSNSNGTMTAGPSGTNGLALGTTFHTSGKYYLEFYLNIVGGSAGWPNFQVGLGTTSITAYDFTHNGYNAYGLQQDGTIATNGGGTGSVGVSLSTGMTVGIAVDLTNSLVWFRANTGSWNNSGTADPASGTGGLSISSLQGVSVNIYPVAQVTSSDSSSLTIVTTTAAFVETPPTGFSPWDSTGGGVGTPASKTISGMATLSDAGVLTSNASAAQSVPSNPTGTTGTATQVMMGLAGTITPHASGRILFVASGDGFNAGAVGDGYIVQLRYGTGSAPSNGAAAAGTAIGGAVHAVSAIVSTTQDIPFALQALVTGLTPGTAYWYDIGLQAIGGGTATIENISLSAVEM